MVWIQDVSARVLTRFAGRVNPDCAASGVNYQKFLKFEAYNHRYAIFRGLVFVREVSSNQRESPSALDDDVVITRSGIKVELDSADSQEPRIRRRRCG